MLAWFLMVRSLSSLAASTQLALATASTAGPTFRSFFLKVVNDMNGAFMRAKTLLV